MKKLLCLALGVLMLLSCACAYQPEEAYDAAPEVLSDATMVDLAANSSREIRVAPVEKAYIRGGNYADMNWREINARLGTDTNTAEPFTLKEDGSKDYTRRVYFTYSLAEIDKFDYKKIFFARRFPC